MRRRWAVYGMEALGLATFVTCASALTLLLFYPGSPVARAVPQTWARDLLLAAGMFPVVRYGIVESPWGVRTGAHINPAVTVAFWRVGLISARDAAGYALGQFAGATLAVSAVAWAVGAPYRDPKIDYALPKPKGVAAAFAIEFAMTFVLMGTLLWMLNDARLKPRMGLWVPLLISAFLATATPYTGMSMNPARTFGSAVWAGPHPGLWLYFVAPVAGALLAAEIYRRRWPGRLRDEGFPPKAG